MKNKKRGRWFIRKVEVRGEYGFERRSRVDGRKSMKAGVYLKVLLKSFWGVSVFNFTINIFYYFYFSRFYFTT